MKLRSRSLGKQGEFSGNLTINDQYRGFDLPWTRHITPGVCRNVLLRDHRPASLGYALEGPSWPAGSTINVRLAFTGLSSGQLQDGFATFNASAADALALWNQQIQLAKFSWTMSSFGGSKGDGQNTAFFSSSVYGQTYGEAIAVTIYYVDGSVMKEADNLFNSGLLWNSYRGALQYNSKKQNTSSIFIGCAP